MSLETDVNDNIAASEVEQVTTLPLEQSVISVANSTLNVLFNSVWSANLPHSITIKPASLVSDLPALQLLLCSLTLKHCYRPT